MSDDDKVELARRVASAAGAKHYGKPVGSLLGGTGGKESAEAPITMERLLSLQRQYQSAKKTGNANLMASVRETFRIEASQYAKGRSLAEIMGPLDQAYARMKEEEKQES